MTFRNIKFPFLSLFLLYAVLVCLAFSYTYKWGFYNYRSTLWADKSGYYIYMPAAFIYGFEAKDYPPDADKNAGMGFSLNKEENKVITKYTSGVAILTFPFFLIAHLIALIMGTADGFSPIYQSMLNFTAPFYTVLGLWFLYRFLKHFVQPKIAVVTCFFILTGTNLYYYTIADAYMSHAYSFFLFSLLLFSVSEYLKKDYSLKWFVVITTALLFILLIRPTDILVAALIPFVGFESFKKSWTVIRSFFVWKRILIAIGLFLLIIGPQMLYWKFAYGSFFKYTYDKEGFDFIASPKIPEVLFSPNNGLFLYNPLYFILFLSIIYFLIKQFKTAISFFIVFVAGLWLIASWQCWYYGSSFGIRPMVQYTAILALPFAFSLNKLHEIKPMLSWLLISVCIIFTVYSLMIVRVYERCFNGSTWNWVEYNQYIKKAGLPEIIPNIIYWKDDFEPETATHTAGIQRFREKITNAYSGTYVSSTFAKYPVTSGFSDRIDNYFYNHIKTVDVEVYVMQENPDTSNYLVCELENNNKIVFRKVYPLNPEKPGQWIKKEQRIQLPETRLDDNIRIFAWNSKGNKLSIDDYFMKFSD